MYLEEIIMSARYQATKQFMVAMVICVILCFAVSVVRGDEDDDGCGSSCHQTDPDPSQMSRCVRYACRRRVFRYFIRFGKRMGGELPSNHQSAGVKEQSSSISDQSESSSVNQPPTHFEDKQQAVDYIDQPQSFNLNIQQPSKDQLLPQLQEYLKDSQENFPQPYNKDFLKSLASAVSENSLSQHLQHQSYKYPSRDAKLLEILMNLVSREN